MSQPQPDSRRLYATAPDVSHLLTATMPKAGPQPGEMQPGRMVYQLQYRNCGKVHCVWCKDKPDGWYGHGPYWYSYRREADGRQRSYYHGRKTPPEATEQDVKHAKEMLAKRIARIEEERKGKRRRRPPRKPA